MAIGGGTRADAERLTNTFALPYTVVADPERKAYQQYGLHKTLFVIQRSGTVLVDKDGVVQYVNRVTNPTHSLDVDTLLRNVRQIA